MRNAFFPVLLACVAGCFHATAQRADWVKHQDSHARMGAGTGAARSTAVFVQTSMLEQIFRNAAWKDTLRTTNSRFTATNQPAVVLREQSGNGSIWNPTRRNHRRFTATGEVLTDTTFSFSVAGVATPRFAKANTFTPAGQLAQSTLRWQLGTTWQNYGRDTYTYTAQALLSQLLLEGFAGGAYYNSARTLYTYNAQNLPTVEEVQQYNDASSNWLPLEKYLSSYTAAGAISQETTQQMPTNGTTYQNYRRETYTYDSQQPARLVQTLVESWTGTAWAAAGQNLFAYDVSGNLSSITTQLYRPTTSSYVNYYRYQYAYQAVTAAATARALDAGLTVLPNPASAGQARLQYRLPLPGSATIEVLDLTGRILVCLQQPGGLSTNQTVTLPAQGLAAGLYVVRLTAHGQSQQQKLVLR